MDGRKNSTIVTGSILSQQDDPNPESSLTSLLNSTVFAYNQLDENQPQQQCRELEVSTTGIEDDPGLSPIAEQGTLDDASSILLEPTNPLDVAFYNDSSTIDDDVFYDCKLALSPRSPAAKGQRSPKMAKSPMPVSSTRFGFSGTNTISSDSGVRETEDEITGVLLAQAIAENNFDRQLASKAHSTPNSSLTATVNDDEGNYSVRLDSSSKSPIAKVNSPNVSSKNNSSKKKKKQIGYRTKISPGRSSIGGRTRTLSRSPGLMSASRVRVSEIKKIFEQTAGQPRIDNKTKTIRNGSTSSVSSVTGTSSQNTVSSKKSIASFYGAGTSMQNTASLKKSIASASSSGARTFGQSTASFKRSSASSFGAGTSQTTASFRKPIATRVATPAVKNKNTFIRKPNLTKLDDISTISNFSSSIYGSCQASTRVIQSHRSSSCSDATYSSLLMSPDSLENAHSGSSSISRQQSRTRRCHSESDNKSSSSKLSGRSKAQSKYTMVRRYWSPSTSAISKNVKLSPGKSAILNRRSIGRANALVKPVSELRKVFSPSAQGACSNAPAVKKLQNKVRVPGIKVTNE